MSDRYTVYWSYYYHRNLTILFINQQSKYEDWEYIWWGISNNSCACKWNIREGNWTRMERGEVPELSLVINWITYIFHSASHEYAHISECSTQFKTLMKTKFDLKAMAQKSRRVNGDSSDPQHRSYHRKDEIKTKSFSYNLFFICIDSMRGEERLTSVFNWWI